MKALLLAAFALSGCQTAHYRAAAMPEKLRVPRAVPANHVNIASMVGPGMGTNQISAGDLLEVTVASGKNDDESKPFQVRVARDGTVNVAPVGSVLVAGLEPVAAEQRIAQAAVERGVFLRPSVTLQMLTPAVNRITVLGAVTEPGVVELPKGSSDLARAIAAAGGTTEEADTKVEILRSHASNPIFNADVVAPADPNGVQLASYEATAPPMAGASAYGPMSGIATHPPQSVRIDLAQATPHPGADYSLGDRDVVMVLPKEKQFIHVTGLVRSPNQFALPHNQDVTVMDAIAMAGGVSSPVADKVFVIRRLPDMPEPAVIQVSIAESKRNGYENVHLGPGDLVSVERTMSTVMVDSIMTMFRVGFSVGGNLVAF